MALIKICPTCGMKSLKQVVRDWKGKFHGRRYVVPSLQFYECSYCKEKVYDPFAMRKIEAYSPAFHRRALQRKSA